MAEEALAKRRHRSAPRWSNSSAAISSAMATGCRRPASMTASCRTWSGRLISICLAATRGNQIRAAQLLGLNRNTLRKKIRDLELEVIRGLRAE